MKLNVIAERPPTPIRHRRPCILPPRLGATGRFAAAIAIALALNSPPASARSGSASAEPAVSGGPAARHAGAPAYFAWRHAQLQRLVDIGYRVARAAAASCPMQNASLGLALEQRDQFAPSDRIAAGLEQADGRPRIAAVATGTPAWQSGLRPGDILALWPRAEIPPATNPTFAGIERAVDMVEARMESNRNSQPEHPLRLLVEQNGVPRMLEIPPVPGCHAWFDLQPTGPANASSGARWIQMTDAVMRLTANDDDGLAFIIGHELGHSLLRSAPERRGMACGSGCEQQADRLGVEFAARAGFAPEAGPAVLMSLAVVRSGFLGARRQAFMERAASLERFLRDEAGQAPPQRNAAGGERSLPSRQTNGKKP